VEPGFKVPSNRHAFSAKPQPGSEKFSESRIAQCWGVTKPREITLSAGDLLCDQVRNDHSFPRPPPPPKKSSKQNPPHSGVGGRRRCSQGWSPSRLLCACCSSSCHQVAPEARHLGRGPAGLGTVLGVSLLELTVTVPFPAPCIANLGPEEDAPSHIPSALAPANTKTFEVRPTS
jgi:hypothetical protein